MSAAILREAAALMREQHGPDHERHEMWTVMAAWLDYTFAVWDLTSAGERLHSKSVARAYLGTTADLPPTHAYDTATEMRHVADTAARAIGGGGGE